MSKHGLPQNRPFLRKAILAAASGLLLALAFPKFELVYLVLVAFVPLFFSLESERGMRAFWLGFIAGFLFYIISLFWITEAMRNYSDLDFVLSIIVLLLFVGYLASLIGAFANIVSMSANSRLSVLTVPMFWVAIELVKAKIMSGFPWNNLNWAVYRQTTFIQIADALGGYGISFGLVAVNWLLYLAISRLMGRRSGPSIPRIAIALAVLLLFAWGYGHYRLSTPPPCTASLKAGIIQPNIPQAMKLDSRFAWQMLQTYAQLAEGLPLEELDMAVLPEAAITVAFNESRGAQSWVKQTFSDRGCPVLLSSVATKDGGFTNSAFVVEPDGRTYRYDKVHLVPFGEYNPFPVLLHFIEVLAGYEGSLEKGEQHFVLPLDDILLGVPICYEIIFPEISREFVNNGADLICTLSNDTWFGETSGPYQHFSSAIFRAVENRIPVLRCANSGISGLIDATGRIVLETPIFVTRADVVQIDLRGGNSLFRKVGDLFAYLCLAGAILAGAILAGIKRAYFGAGSSAVGLFG
ncbi:MAG: apolipoprotein N-acyltransferase [Candidatus Coatesbacteria bacterium]|nr:apolipoprotein N-acyltransferase [Candidatus Coatesbacteria bacterium]